MIYKQHIVTVKVKNQEELFVFNPSDFACWIGNWEIEDIEWMRPIEIEVKAPFDIDREESRTSPEANSDLRTP